MAIGGGSGAADSHYEFHHIRQDFTNGFILPSLYILFMFLVFFLRIFFFLKIILKISLIFILKSSDKLIKI